MVRDGKDVTSHDEAACGLTHATLDRLFRRAGVRAPDRPALVDAPEGTTLATGRPRVLTFRQADRAISAFAARMNALRLAPGAVVALHLPNTLHSVVALLGTLRAGLTAAPLPPLWRKQDIVAALAPVGARAIVTFPQRAAAAMQAAAELFPVRYVCGFGQDLPDGVVPLDDCFDDRPTALPPPYPSGTARDGPAVVTFDMTADGPQPVPRLQAELVAAGRAAAAEMNLAAGSNVLTTLAPGSFAAIALSVMPWLLAGGTLSLHHPFDPEGFAAQTRAPGPCTVLLPGPVVAALDDARLIGPAVRGIVALWRAPERLAEAPALRMSARLADVACFGELGFHIAARGEDGRPAPIALGAAPAIETARGERGTLLLRGPMLPQRVPHRPTDGSGFVDTGLPCRREGDGLVMTGRPAGVVSIGGQRLRLRAVEESVAAISPHATIVALPDALTGERLAGSAPDPAAMRRGLDEQGAHPLVAAAFRPRPPQHASPSPTQRNGEGTVATMPARA